MYAHKLNDVLYDIATKTRCKCQRRSQCIAQTGPNFQKIYVGFVVVVAFAHDIAWSASSDLEYYNTAEKFSRGLRDHWILGDCGNSVLILVWERRMLIHVWADEKASLYVTTREKERILSEIGQISNRKDIFDALLYILGEMKKQFDGEPEKPTDIGKLALITASSVAMISVVFVMGCVCAFRFQIGSCKRDDFEVLDGNEIDEKVIFDHRVDDNDLISSSPSPPSILRNNNIIVTRSEFV
uniref:Uncharacterized protein n=1 Tax=Romanomermis culicivorax TaxID=13658 RepID=A0A915I6L8_ROMCU